jgi:hypothetical protein
MFLFFWGEAAVQFFYSWYKPSSGFIVGGTDLLSEIAFAAFQCESGSKGRDFFWWEYVESEFTRESLLWPDLTNYWWSNIPLVVPTSWNGQWSLANTAPQFEELSKVIPLLPMVFQHTYIWYHICISMFIKIYLYRYLSIYLSI